MPSWRVVFTAGGAAGAALAFIWLIAGAIQAFQSADGAEYAGLIGAHPHLLLSCPQDATLALLEALPWTQVLTGLAGALVACALFMRLVAEVWLLLGRPGPSRGVTC